MMTSKKELIKIREQLKEALDESIIIFNKLHQELKEVEIEMKKYEKLKKFETSLKKHF
jgi:hypothetical protein